MWFTEYNSPSGKNLGRVTTEGALAEYTVPELGLPAPKGITTGPDGALWVAPDQQNTIDRVTTDGVGTHFPLDGTGHKTGSIVTGPDGNLWFTDNNYAAIADRSIGRITPTGVVTEFPVPGAPHGLTVGPDGALWFCETNAHPGNRIGRITTSGEYSDFPVPDVPGAALGDITLGLDGALWFTIQRHGLNPVGGVGRMTPSGALQKFEIPHSYPQTIIAGPDGALWIPGSSYLDRVGLDGTVLSFDLPAQLLITGPDDNLWFVEPPAPSRLGVLEVGPPVHAVQRAHGDVLGRSAVPAELSAWMTNLIIGYSGTDFARFLLATTEAHDFYVAGRFRNLLHRPADPAGLQLMSGLLARGRSREWVQALLIGSSEYLVRRGAGTTDGFLGALYSDVLRRELDPLSRAYLGRLLDLRVPREFVAAIVLASREARGLLVSKLYRKLLRRPVDPASRLFWVEYLMAGASDEAVIANLIGSDEYLALP
jgi:virginiamycin B lyase